MKFIVTIWVARYHFIWLPKPGVILTEISFYRRDTSVGAKGRTMVMAE